MLESTWHCTWHPGLLYGSHAGGCSRKRFSRKTCPCTSPAAPSCSCPSRCRAAAAAALHAALSSLAEPLPRVRQPTSPLYIYWILKPKITLASIILHSRVRQLLYITKPKYKCTKSARARGALKPYVESPMWRVMQFRFDKDGQRATLAVFIPGFGSIFPKNRRRVTECCPPSKLSKFTHFYGL